MVEPEKPRALANAIQELYDSPSRLDQLGKKGRAFAIANYSFEQSLEGYESLLSSLVDTLSVAATLPKNVSIKS